MHRSLCIDGVTVAEDFEADSGVPGTSINIGLGKDYLPGTYWSGLINDIRIDKWALSAEEIVELVR